MTVEEKNKWLEEFCYQECRVHIENACNNCDVAKCLDLIYEEVVWDGKEFRRR